MRIPSSWTLYLPCYVIVVTVIRVWFCGAAPLCMVEDRTTVQARTQALQPPHTQISSDTDPWCGEDSQKLTLRAQPELCIMNGGFWKFNSHGWETAGRAMRSWGQWPASAAVSERSHTADWSCLYQTGIYYCFKLKELNLACLQKKEKNSFFLCRHHEMDPGGKNTGLHAVQWELSLTLLGSEICVWFDICQKLFSSIQTEHLPACFASRLVCFLLRALQQGQLVSSLRMRRVGTQWPSDFRIVSGAGEPAGLEENWLVTVGMQAVAWSQQITGCWLCKTSINALNEQFSFFFFFYLYFTVLCRHCASLVNAMVMFTEGNSSPIPSCLL